MRGFKRETASFVFFFFILFIFMAGISFAQEEITLSTYYPAPYGVYKGLQIYPSNAAPAACNANSKGLLYYSGTYSNTATEMETDTMYYCDGSLWRQIGSLPSVDLGTVTSGGIPYTLPQPKEQWQLIYPQNYWITGGVGWTSILNSFGMQIDISAYGRSLYMVEWDPACQIDANKDLGGKYRLQYQLVNLVGDASTWINIDTTELFMDYSADPPVFGDGLYYNASGEEPRSVTVYVKSRQRYIRFRLKAWKNAGLGTCDFQTLAGTYIKVTKLSSF